MNIRMNKLPIQWILFPLFFFVILGCKSTDKLPTVNYNERNFDLQGHRGSRGLMPENSLPAFREALKYKMTTLELDTVLTADNELIVHHDLTANPNLCLDENHKPVQPLPIRTLKVAQLKLWDCGSIGNTKFPRQKKVPKTKLITLPEFFEFMADYEKKNPWAKSVKFNIELKMPKTVNQTEMDMMVNRALQIISEANAVSRTTIQSFHLPVLPLVKKKNPLLRISALFTISYFRGFWAVMGISPNAKPLIEQAKKYQADIISPHYLYVTPEFMRLARQKNLIVLPWTVNEKPLIRKMLDLGVDGIISDYPDLLQSTWKEWRGIK